MILGLTGSRKGLTDEQVVSFLSLVKELNSESRISTVNHGDCTGSDADMHKLLAGILGNVFILHPASGVEAQFQANCTPFRWRFLPLPPLQRNENIVAVSDVLIATPKGKESVRSGTWATVRYARKTGVKIYIIYPDGIIETNP